MSARGEDSQIGGVERRVEQAVILAGGRGTRLAPLTDSRPKPMIVFHGKPFLEYLVEMLAEQGIRRILMLLGYLPEIVRGHFGDGRRWGVQIEYSVTPVEDETGQRVKSAEERVDDVFLLLYCDNYWPMRLAPIWHHFKAGGLIAQITVYRNLDRYSKDNVALDFDGSVARYDRTRTSAGLKGVEIGFMLLRKEALALIPAGNASFEESVLSALAPRGQLGAFVTDHRYYSVGSHARLGLTEMFLARRPAVILDRDGVLNQKMGRAEYVRSWDDWKWLPGAKEALRIFREAGFLVLVATNQPGVARRALTHEDLTDIHARMKFEAAQAGGCIESIYACLHDWDEGCECRKPRPGMLFQAQHEHNLDLSRVAFVGDDERDAAAAEAAGCRPILNSEGESLIDVARRLVSEQTAGRKDVL